MIGFCSSWDESKADTYAQKPNEITRGALNKYSVHSMTHDIRSSLRNDIFPNDPEARENRKLVNLARAQIRKAKIMFVTLGLTESWLDTETGIVMNAHPGPQFFKKFGTRFQFVDYGYQEILAELRDLVSLVRGESGAGIKFIFTVSPVPFAATFRDLDVIVANTSSKSTLRAVAERTKLDGLLIDYFPSYEFVINSPRHLAWEADQLHVRSVMVEHIMETFKKSYYGERSSLSSAA